ncbi:MAG: cell division protein SepF [Microthrixaceae bacterium]
MPGILRKSINWLGLGVDEEYDADGMYAGGYDDDYGYDDAAEHSVDLREAVSPDVGPREPVRPAAAGQSAHTGAQRRTVAAPDWGDASEGSGSVRVLPSSTTAPRPRAGNAVAPEPVRSGGSVRPVSAPSPTQVVVPSTYNDAQEVGDAVRRGQIVILQLNGLDAGLRRRLVDFSSGAAYSQGYRVDFVGHHTYVLLPEGADLSEEDRRRAVADRSD